MGQVTLMTDLVVIVLGGFVFGNIDAVLYGVISTYAASVIIDTVSYTHLDVYKRQTSPYTRNRLSGKGPAWANSLFEDNAEHGLSLIHISIGHVAPEAAVGGNIALIEEGDVIDIDIPGGRIGVRAVSYTHLYRDAVNKTKRLQPIRKQMSITC